MVLGKELALHLEQALRVAHMAHQVARDGRERLELAGEDLLPGLEHRILGIPGIQIHRAVVGIDRSLDGVADVVGLLGAQALDSLRAQGGRVLGDGTQVHLLGVGVGVRGGVAVDDPLDPAIHHSRVDATVQGQIGGDLGHALLGRAVVEDLRVGGDAVREEDLVGSKADGVEDPGQEVAHRGAAVALEGVGGSLGAGGIVELPA